MITTFFALAVLTYSSDRDGEVRRDIELKLLAAWEKLENRYSHYKYRSVITTFDASVPKRAPRRAVQETWIHCAPSLDRYLRSVISGKAETVFVGNENYEFSVARNDASSTYVLLSADRPAKLNAAMWNGALPFATFSKAWLSKLTKLEQATFSSIVIDEARSSAAISFVLVNSVASGVGTKETRVNLDCDLSLFGAVTKIRSKRSDQTFQQEVSNELFRDKDGYPVLRRMEMRQVEDGTQAVLRKEVHESDQLQLIPIPLESVSLERFGLPTSVLPSVKPPSRSIGWWFVLVFIVLAAVGIASSRKRRM